MLYTLYIHIYSLFPIHMSLFHFVPMRRLADDGGGSMACFFMGCNSKEIGHETLKKKPGWESDLAWGGWGVGGWGIE